MAEASQFLEPADLAKVANLHVAARMVVEGYTSGIHRSPHKGFSVEFKQHRQYVPGDDLRFLDWKVFGKTDRYYIREYEEETNLRAILFVDMSGSMSYTGRAGISKHHYATRLAACLGHLLLKQTDAVGMLTFDDHVRRFIPARSRAGHLRVVIDELQRSQTGGETELGTVFQEMVPKLKRRGLVVLISDCFADVTSLGRTFAQLRQGRHDIIVFQIMDRDELEFPFRRWSRFESLEKDGHHVMVDPAMLRQSYLAKLASFNDELKQVCNRHRIDLVPMTTDQPYADALAYFLARRKRLA